MEHFDVIVIGSGPGGERAAATSAFLGRRAAIVEKGLVLGGVSTNTGTIPSKTLRETALAFSGLRARRLYGVDLSLRRACTIADLMHHEQQVKESEQARVASNLAARGATLFHGKASFVDPHTIRITAEDRPETLISGDSIIIATGSSPFHPPEFPFEHELVHDSDEILTLQCLPKSLGVVGAGVIGAEYACIFAALGVEVHILDGRDALLPFLDQECSKTLEAAMVSMGVKFHWNERVDKCVTGTPGEVTLVCSSGQSLVVDGVLIAAGRTSNTEDLNLPAAGITPGKRGLLTVDATFRTSVPHIFAVGDVIGFPALAATSAEQGRTAAFHAAGREPYAAAASVLPTGIYTIPEVSMVGETEESLKAKGVDYIVGHAYARNSARGKMMGDTDGFLKLLFRREDMKLIGAHALGESACETIHVALIVMVAEQGAQLLFETCFNYPTLGELYKTATLAALVEKFPTGQ